MAKLRRKVTEESEYELLIHIKSERAEAACTLGEAGLWEWTPCVLLQGHTMPWEPYVYNSCVGTML